MRLDRLPVLLCWLLGLMGAAYSSSAAWVCWLGANFNSAERIERALPLAERLGMPTAGYWVALADLRSDEEERFLRRALVADERCLPALSRLAVIEEFRGNRDGARELVGQAIRYHRSFKSYMAGLTQAARWGETSRVEDLARGALAYCPRDADGVYAQLSGVEMAERVLVGARRVDFLRYLIGQKRLEEAVSYQERLERSVGADRLRLELCEVLFWAGKRGAAHELFGKLHPEFARDGSYNARLMTRPTSLGFDWRLSEDRRVQLDWRPGEIEVKVADREEELELVSILLGPRQEKATRVTPMWTGQTEGLHWKVDAAGEGYKRVALVVPAGAQRRFELKEVRFE